MSAQWDRIAKKNKDRMLGIVKKSTGSMGKRIIRVSPVDTGRFKGSWNTAIGEPNLSIETSIGAGLLPILGQAKIGDDIYFTNNQPYAMRLEFGWSQQAPAGMVRVTLADFQGFVDRAARATNRGL